MVVAIVRAALVSRTGKQFDMSLIWTWSAVEHAVGTSVFKRYRNVVFKFFFSSSDRRLPRIVSRLFHESHRLQTTLSKAQCTGPGQFGDQRACAAVATVTAIQPIRTRPDDMAW